MHDIIFRIGKKLNILQVTKFSEKFSELQTKFQNVQNIFQIFRKFFRIFIKIFRISKINSLF